MTKVKMAVTMTRCYLGPNLTEIKVSAMHNDPFVQFDLCTQLVSHHCSDQMLFNDIYVLPMRINDRETVAI